MTTQTKTRPTESTGTHWPPLVHIINKRTPVVEGDTALCGAKLAGINNPDSSWPVCKECVKIARRR